MCCVDYRSQWIRQKHSGMLPKRRTSL
uniref:Uncharacterized protein n=1 Tax=Rhizophora mucronata TaxID=61149 RepID=A0A2P2PPF3_RHIMU